MLPAALDAALNDALTGRPQRLIIDAARLRLLDACCISILVSVPRTTSTQLEMINARGLVYRALKVSKLLDTFAVAERETTAFCR